MVLPVCTPWDRIKNLKTTHRYRCAPNPPPAGLVPVMHWDIQPHFSSTNLYVLVAAALESAACAAFTQLHSVRVDQHPVLTMLSATPGLLRTVKSDICRDAVMPSKKKKKVMAEEGRWGGLFLFYSKVQRCLPTCRIHPVVHANDSL